MTALAQKLQTELTRLSDEERGELAHFLIQSLDSRADEGAESAWDEELELRAEEITSGQTVGEPAEKVFSELQAKYS